MWRRHVKLQAASLRRTARRRANPSEAAITNVAPSADETIRSGDVLALLGSNDRLNQLDELLGRRV
jgi:hypothetical protein